MVTISDTFDRADGALGAAWASGASWRVVSNALQKTDGTTEFAMHNTSLAGADQSVQVTLLARTAGDFSLHARTQFAGTTDGTVGTGYVLYHSGGILQFFRHGGGGAYSGFGPTFSDTPTAGKVYRLEVEGSTIRGLIDGVTRITATDTTYAAGGFVGVRSNGGTGTRLDDFTASDLGVVAGPVTVLAPAGEATADAAAPGALGEVAVTVVAPAGEATADAAAPTVVIPVNLPPGQPALSRWYAAFDASPTTARIAYLGDSTSDSGFGSGANLPLRDRLISAYAGAGGLLGGLQTGNVTFHGISGNQVPGYWGTVRGAVMGLSGGVDLVIVSFGLNDIQFNTEAVLVSRMEALVAEIRVDLPIVDILLRMPNMIAQDGGISAANASLWTTRLRSAYQTISTSITNVAMFDSQARVFGTVSVATTDPSVTGLYLDQLHPSVTGNTQVADAMTVDYIAPREVVYPVNVTTPAGEATADAPGGVVSSFVEALVPAGEATADSAGAVVSAVVSSFVNVTTPAGEATADSAGAVVSSFVNVTTPAGEATADSAGAVVSSFVNVTTPAGEATADSAGAIVVTSVFTLVVAPPGQVTADSAGAIVSTQPPPVFTSLPDEARFTTKPSSLAVTSPRPVSQATFTEKVNAWQTT